jgi:arabinofuranosyltransferase
MGMRVLALAVLLAAAVTAVVMQYQQVADGYMTDDAFISFRYSVNLADGLGLVWNPGGERVEGYTNFGWVLLIALAKKFGADPVDSSRALGLAFSAGTLLAVPVLAAQFRSAWTWRWWVLTSGAVLALALNTGFSVWTFAGLETTCFAFFVTLAVALHLYEERTEALPALSPAAFVAAALVRPDAVVVWGVVAVFKCARLTSGDRLRELRRIALWAAVFVGAYGVYWLWRWDYYGDFFPNTYYLKSGGHSRPLLERGWEYFWGFFTIYWIWLSALGAFSVWNERLARYRPARCLLAIGGVWSLYIIDSGGDWMPFFRFFVPILPMAYVLIVHGAIDGADWLSRRVHMGAAAPALSLALAAALAFSAVRVRDDGGARNPAGFEANPEILPGAVDTEVHREIGSWMRANLPADYEVALVASGIVPYYSRLPTIDMLGVNDRHIAHRDIPLGYGVAGHEKEDGGYVVSREPEIIWLELSLEPAPRSAIDDYKPPRYTEWVPVKTNITTNAYIWFLYRPVAIELPHGWLNLLVHRDVDLPALDEALQPADP